MNQDKLDKYKKELQSVVEDYIEMRKSEYYHDIWRQIENVKTIEELDSIERIIDDWIDT